MNKNEILSIIKGIAGAEMGRANKSNFVVIPTDEGYVKVNVVEASMKDANGRKAFNAEAALAEYKAWEAESALRAAEQAAKPKAVRGPNLEAQARRDELDAKIAALPPFAECTATDIMAALTGQLTFNVTRMSVGQSAKRLVDKGVLVVTTKENDKKSYYTKV